MQGKRGRTGQRVLNRSLHADQSGMALIYVTAALPVIIGFALLAVDASRVYILNSSLQKGADALALAMAAELDRTSDSISRAERARDNLLKPVGGSPGNQAIFTESFGAISGSATVDTYFLKSLPATDDLDITPSFRTTLPEEASYVQVVVKPATYDTIFPASFINAAASLTTSATAVAGMQPGACNIQPMFICNPLEPPTNTDVYATSELMAHVKDPAKRRRLFMLKAFDNSKNQATFSPGNFGYINTNLGSNGGGARDLKAAISEAVPGSCASKATLDTQPGNIGVAADAFNVRFDMYQGSFNRSDATLRPARNTRKSYLPSTTGNGNGNGNSNPCNPQFVNIYSGTTPTAMGFPRDSCLVSNNCSNSYGGEFGGRIGGGDWNNMFDTYMNVNFANASQTPQKDPATGAPFSSSSLPSRYDVYRAEIDQNKIGSRSMATPQCYNGSVSPNDLPDRRLMFVAIANCIAKPLEGGRTELNPAAFGVFFLTEPVERRGGIGSGQNDAGSIYGELIDIIKPGVGSGTNGAIIADNVQLYR